MIIIKDPISIVICDSKCVIIQICDILEMECPVDIYAKKYYSISMAKVYGEKSNSRSACVKFALLGRSNVSFFPIACADSLMEGSLVSLDTVAEEIPVLSLRQRPEPVSAGISSIGILTYDIKIPHV